MEAISLASGLVTLVSFAFSATNSLSQLVKSFNSRQTRVRELITELEALTGVLESLTSLADSCPSVDLKPLKLPLLQCGNTCKEFQTVIEECLSRSGGHRQSFRDWAKLKHRDDDIDGIRRRLTRYKLTINIALTDATLRTSAVNAEALGEYKELIETAKSDLEAYLDVVDEKLNLVLGQALGDSDVDALELQRIKEERQSTAKWIQVCAQLSDHISQIQPAPESMNPTDFPESVTSAGLRECKEALTSTAAKLEKHTQVLMDRLITKSKASVLSQEDVSELERLRDEWEATRHGVNICSRADTHLRENVSDIENYSTGDALQFMVSTNGKVLHGRNRGLGWRSRQVGGYLSDLSVQQISRDMTTINVKHIENERPANLSSSSPALDTPAELDPNLEYNKRYGPGFNLR